MKYASLCVASLLALAEGSPALADTTVKVTLWDKPAIMNSGMKMNMGMGMHGKMSMAGMGIDLDMATVRAGKGLGKRQVAASCSSTSRSTTPGSR